jgi:hypothetical protein
MPHTMTTEAADLDQDLDSDAGVASSDLVAHARVFIVARCLCEVG